MSSPRSFERFQPASSADMEPVAGIFIARWHALFDKIIGRVSELDATAWVEETTKLAGPDSHFTITSVSPDNAQMTYRRLIENPAAPPFRIAGVDIALDSSRLLLSCQGGGIHRIIGSSTIFYRSAQIIPTEGKEKALSQAGRIDQRSKQLTWEALEAPARPPQLDRLTFSPLDETDNDSPTYRSHYTPINGHAPYVDQSLSRSVLTEREESLLKTHGPYAVVFDQLKTTLSTMSMLAGEDHRHPFGQ